MWRNLRGGTFRGPVFGVNPKHSALDGVSLEVNSSVGKQFDAQIRATVHEVLAQLGVTAVALKLEDRGALDCVLRARLKAALLRATDEAIDWGKVL